MNTNEIDLLVKSFTDKNEQLPETIRSPEYVTVATNTLRELKIADTTLRAKKKAAEQPFEEARKEADSSLKKARQGKKDAGEVFLGAIANVAGLVSSIKGKILEYNSFLQKAAEEADRIRREAADKAEKLRLEAERRDEEVMSAIEKGDDEVLENMEFSEDLEAKATEIEDKAKVEEKEVIAAGNRGITGATMRKIVSYKITDIDAVPNSYFAVSLDLDTLEGDLKIKFPGIVFNMSSITYSNIDLVNTRFIQEELDGQRVRKALVGDKSLVIPGIERVIEERVVI